jgi:glycosyltransferase involved in cell wall biosynthesis
LRIALVTPLLLAVPPITYGGTERVVAALANGLTWAGHDVSVFATADSRIDAHLIPCRDRPIMTDPRPSSEVADQLTMLRRVREWADEFDVIHFHTDLLQFPLFDDIAFKTLTTFHGRLDLVGLREFFAPYRHFPVVSASDNQRRPLPDLNWQATIPHGYPLDQYRMIPRTEQAGEEGYLAFLGRVDPDKGIRQAISIAQRTGRRLKIAARINDLEQHYWRNEILPLIDGHRIEYVGEIGEDQKSEFLSMADALLFPIAWPEPFGLTMIEAMACGTPVLAFGCGSVPEVIDEGITGTIVCDVEEAANALEDTLQLDRARIRAHFEARFSDTAMVASYVDVYRRLNEDCTVQSGKHVA